MERAPTGVYHHPVRSKAQRLPRTGRRNTVRRPLHTPLLDYRPALSPEITATTTNTTSRAGFNGAMHRVRQHSLASIAWGVGRARVVHVRAWACESVMCVRACLGGAARHQGCALRVVAAALAELPDTSVPSSGQPNFRPVPTRLCDFALPVAT